MIDSCAGAGVWAGPWYRGSTTGSERRYRNDRSWNILASFFCSGRKQRRDWHTSILTPQASCFLTLSPFFFFCCCGNYYAYCKYKIQEFYFSGPIFIFNVWVRDFSCTTERKPSRSFHHLISILTLDLSLISPTWAFIELLLNQCECTKWLFL